MKKNVILILVIALFLLFNSAHADRIIWYVHPDSALNTIQAGLDSCADNDIVLVAAGTYYERLIWPDKQGIVLTSVSGATSTIIDGEHTCTVIIIDLEVDSATIIDGFTIQHGQDTGWPHVGGIFCRSHATISNNIITENVDGFSGDGGIKCWGSALISGNTITNNVGDGVTCVDSGNPVIIGNTISSNWKGIDCGNWELSVIITGNIITDNPRGGIHCLAAASVQITDNFIAGNRGHLGAAIACINCDAYSSITPIIRGNIIIGNRADVIGGIYCCYSSPLIDSNTISYNNPHGVYCRDSSDPVINYNNISDNIGYGVVNIDPRVIIDAKYNWWGDASGPYHPVSNPGGLGDSVSDYVDFIPWLDTPAAVEENPLVKSVERHDAFGATIFSGPLQLPKGRKCKVLDITGRVVASDRIKPGIYFIEIDGKITGKVVKVR